MLPTHMSAALLRLDAFIPFRLSITSNLVSETIAGTYQALFGLTIPEWRLIAVIAEEDGPTQQRIGARTRMDKVTVSRAAIALVTRGLIERRPHAEDRRAQRLFLTEAGTALYAQVAPKALELEGRILARFTADEIATFTAMLARMDEATLAVAAEG